jgi:hypothetical protein
MQKSLPDNLQQYNIDKIQPYMPPARFEPLIPASERSQTHALDHESTGIANGDVSEYKFLAFRTGPSKINKPFKTKHPFLP